MSTAKKVPGEASKISNALRAGIGEVPTAISAFIGYTQFSNREGKVIKAVKVSSLPEYESVFGRAKAENITIQIRDTVKASVVESRTVKALVREPVNTMFYHLQMYFANGGGPCYIVSVGVANNTISKADLKAGLACIKNHDEPTLLVFPEGVNVSRKKGSLLGAKDYYELQALALQQAAELKDRFVIMDCYNDDPTTLRDTIGGIGNNNLKYGAAYHPFLLTTINYEYTEESVVIDHRQSTVEPNRYNLRIRYGTTNKLIEVRGTIRVADRDKIYEAANDILKNTYVKLNPSPTIAGLIAIVDRTKGVWKAPANVSLINVQALTRVVTKTEQDDLNVDPIAGKSINVIREFAGKGILVWGARTLAGNDNEWRYISVCRLCMMIEENTKKSTRHLTAEPNDAKTWVKVDALIQNYLTAVWRDGALQGSKAEHAFYVAVGLNKTMTSADILAGKMVIEIGLAITRPAEFIMLRFSHEMKS